MRTRFGDPLADLFSVQLVAGDQTGILLLQRVVPLADIVGVMPVAIVSASKKVHLFDDEGKLAGTSGTGAVDSHWTSFDLLLGSLVGFKRILTNGLFSRIRHTKLHPSQVDS